MFGNRLKKYLLVLSGIAILLLSCRKEVEIELPKHDQLLVINSFLVEEEEIKVHISQSGQSLERFDSFIVGADVVLFINGIPEILFQGGDRWYHSNQKALANCDFRVCVSYKDFVAVEAVDSIPDAVHFRLQNFVAKDAIDDWGNIFSSVEVVFKNDPDRKNYYEIEADIGKIVRQESNTTLYGGVKSNDVILKNENFSETYHETLPFSDLMFNGDSITLKISFAYNVNVDYVDIILRSVSENYYRYKKSLYKHMDGQSYDIWNSVNPIGLFTNIENGYGIFAGYSQCIDSIYTYGGDFK